ncbi:DUF998 domain-containing protein [Nereida sp. MMG025]|uniref:DUF998 domain-containing protein n=1 Tax=Nereida sp. MMG025 TaxID=2909981 RepID=UPI001F3AD00A|nr:DUF998 domain-containing protein [Nereida sp. MMG025]MCF6445863.1 DUF998 domain-containing protein [Nereida sp. MMG025]
MHHHTTDPTFLRICAIIGALGVLAMLAGNVIGTIVVPGHDPMADTISDLAAGRYEIIQDIALYGYAAGFFALALGLSNIHTRDRRWTLGIFAIALMAACLTVIGARNEYGDGDSSGVVIHIYLVYALGALLVIAPFALASGLSRIARGYGIAARAFGVAWIFAAPVFFVLPTQYDGGYERALGVLASLWVLSLAHALWTCAGKHG